jgi:flagellin-like hook-associated protein FlgL
MSDTVDVSQLGAAGLVLELKVIHRDIQDVRSSLTNLTNAISRLAVVDNELLNIKNDINRISASLTSIESRVRTMEIATPLTQSQSSKSSNWIERLSWAGLGLLVMFVIKKLGMA